MHALARVLFHVQPGDPNALGGAAGFDLDEAMFGERLVELRDLVSLGQVGIEIIFSREDGGLVDLAIQRHRREHREFHSFLVQYGKRSRKPKADGADVSVRRRAKCRGAAAEDLRSGQQLYVDF